MTQPSIVLLKYRCGYLVAFVASSVPMFCWAFKVKHLSRSGPLLILRSLEMKLRRTTGAFSPTGIGNTSRSGRYENELAMTFFLPG